MKNEIGHFKTSFKHKVCKAYLQNNRTKVSIWREHVGQQEDHGLLLKWLRDLGYIDRPQSQFRKLVAMDSPEESDSFTEHQLKKRIRELEKQLKDAEMKAIAYSTMVDIAEQEFNLSIRKKYNTKPSKK